MRRGLPDKDKGGTRQHPPAAGDLELPSLGLTAITPAAQGYDGGLTAAVAVSVSENPSEFKVPNSRNLM